MTEKSRAYAALIFICIVWGTTYLAIRWVVEVYPPFGIAGVRQLLSGIIIAGVALTANKQVNLSAKNLLRQVLIGTLMIAVGNGLVSYGQKTIPSGVAAMVCATMPIWAVVLNLALSSRERLNKTIVLGMGTGLLGVALIFRTDLQKLGNTAYLAGIGLTLLATMGWAVGSVLSRRWSTAVNPFFDAGLQVIAGGLVLLAVSGVTEDWALPATHPPRAVWSFIYLVIFGSVLAYSFYQYALKRLPVGVVTVYAYVNPLVAVLLGAAFGENLTAWTAASFVGIVLGVYLVNRGYRAQQAIAQHAETFKHLPEAWNAQKSSSETATS